MKRFSKIAAIAGLSLPLLATADPRIDTRTGECHIPYDQFNQMNEIFTNPSEENGADIVVFNQTADGVCASEDVKVKPALLASFFPPAGSYTLPYKIVLTGNSTGFLCKMRTGSGATYYTSKWKSVVKVDGGPGLKLDLLLICRDGVQRKAASAEMAEMTE